MSIYDKKMQIMKELLYELDAICREHGLEYSIVGKPGQMVYADGCFPEQFDALFVAMTGGDIARFEAIVNDRNDGHRQVETIRNNPHCRSLMNRYCNSDTTLINIKSFGNHINYGIYIEILEITRTVPNTSQGKRLNYMKKAWKGSQKRWSACTAKQKAVSIPLKAGIRIVGKQHAGNMLYKRNENLCGIDRWDQIESYKNIAVGRTRIRNGNITPIAELEDGREIRQSWEPQDVYAEGHQLKFATVFLNRSPQALQSHATVMANEILDPDISFRDVLDSDIAADILDAQKKRDAFIHIITKDKIPAAETKQAWNTYLMTRDVIDLREVYDEDKLQTLNTTIEEADIEAFTKEITPYIRVAGKWRRKHIPFIQNEDVVELVRKAIPVFYGDDPEEAERMTALIEDAHMY